MKWIKQQCVVIVTLATLLAGAFVTWGKMQEVCRQIDSKADKAQVASDRAATVRELDLIEKQLAAINTRMDGVIVRQAIIAPPSQ
jgi:hypothetical protein